MNNAIWIRGLRDCSTIEVTGSLLGRFEVAGEEGYVELSTGDVFRFVFAADGDWTVKHTHKSTISLLGWLVTDTWHSGIRVRCQKTPLEWVDFWDEWPPPEEEKQERIVSSITESDDFLLSGHDLNVVYSIIMKKRHRLGEVRESNAVESLREKVERLEYELARRSLTLPKLEDQ